MSPDPFVDPFTNIGGSWQEWLTVGGYLAFGLFVVWRVLAGK